MVTIEYQRLRDVVGGEESWSVREPSMTCTPFLRRPMTAESSLRLGGGGAVLKRCQQGSDFPYIETDRGGAIQFLIPRHR